MFDTTTHEFLDFGLSGSSDYELNEHSCPYGLADPRPLPLPRPL